MDNQKVDIYLMTNGKFFESHLMGEIREKLIQADDSKFVMVQSLNLKDPTISLIVSIVAGTYGIDRFIIGDIGLGVGKLLTCGGLGIWTIVDWFMISARTKQVNYEQFKQLMG